MTKTDPVKSLSYNLKIPKEIHPIRSAQQNKALHKYCQEVADELNNSGIDMAVLVANLNVGHTKESVKEIWRAIAKAKYNKESTAALTTKEVTEVYDEVNRMLANVGVHVGFPSSNLFGLEENY